ncbi:MAG: hypothetical protein RLN89_06615, partial [Parvibaculum sp.]
MAVTAQGMGKVRGVARAATLILCAFIALLAIPLFGLDAHARLQPEQPSEAPSEIRDFSDWDLNEQGPIRLETGWRVFRDRLLPPEQLSGADCRGANSGFPSERTSLPDVWGPAITTEMSSGHGVATYCIDLMLPKSEERLGISIGNLRTITHITAIYQEDEHDHGKIVLIHRNGDPLRAPSAESLNTATPIIVLPYGEERVRLVVELANYVHKQGGIVETPVVDYYSHLDAQQRRDASLPMALVIVLAMVSAGSLIIGHLTGNTTRFAIFAFLTAASAFRVFFVSDIIWDYWPSFSLARKYDFEYLSLFLVLPAYYAFVIMLLGVGKDWFISRFVYAVSGSFICFSLVATPLFGPGTVTLLREPFQLFWIIGGAYIAYVTIKAVIVSKGEKIDAILVLCAAGMMAGYEFLSAIGLVPFSMEWAQLIILLVTILHARAFALSFRDVQAERDGLTKSLVDANTALEAKA